nr:hypothetical protein [Tanacetum cinerariifolium]
MKKLISGGSSDEYYSSDEIEGFDDVDFYTEGEENVVIKNLTTHDSFLNKLCGNTGMFRDYLDESVLETEGEALDDSDDAHIEHIHKQALANYGVANGYQLWYAKNDWRSLLVYCGRSVEGDRRIIGLDGCFLKHTCRGELLTAIDAIGDWLPSAEEGQRELETCKKRSLNLMHKAHDQQLKRLLMLILDGLVK